MPKVTYIEFDGRSRTVEVATGNSVMEGAVEHGIEGIVAACGGCMSCATCHCYIDSAWQDKVGSPDDDESDLLDTVEARQHNSRLSCQVKVSEELDGLVVRLPESQY